MAVMIQQQECSSSPSFHLSCSPLAVGHDTEGLAIMLNVGEYRILLDCGLENIKSLLVDQSLPPHWVFCTHAHHDHGRGLLSYMKYILIFLFIVVRLQKNFYLSIG